MASDSKDSSRQQEDSLANLRARATCPICKEFYIKPKRLKNCSHVFCLNCIKRHLQVNRHVNFPGCPMCRTPFSNTLSEIDDLEPGRAEEDIVDFVKPFETCDLCGKKENPKLKCSECTWFICDNCKPSHSKLKHLHTVEPLIPSGAYKRPYTKHNLTMCEQHPDKVLDLFCFICQSVLCSHCERFFHAECKFRCGNAEVLQRFSMGFLLEYVLASDERTLLFQNSNLSSVVYFTEFVKEAKAWLSKLKAALDECLEFFRDYNSNIIGIVDEIENFENFTPRTLPVKEEIDNILKLGESIYFNNKNLLEKASDSEVAESILNIEQEASRFFRFRRKYTLEVRPLKLTVENGATFRQVSNSSLQVNNGALAGTLHIAYFEPFDTIYSTHLQFKNGNKCEEGRSKAATAPVDINKTPVFHDLICGIEDTEREVSSESKRNAYEDIVNYKCFSYKFTCSRSLNYSDNNLYTNQFIERTEVQMLPELANVNTIDIGYTDAFPSNYGSRAFMREFEVRVHDNENPRIVVSFSLAFSHTHGIKFITGFANVFVLPFLFDVSGTRRQQTLRESDEIPCLVSFIGNKNSNFGLETVFMYFDRDVLNTNGICVRTSITKFKNNSPIDLMRGRLFQSVKNKSGTFSFFSLQTDESFMSSHRSNIIDTSEHMDSLVRFDVFKHTETSVPVTYKKVALLCSLTKGLYFAKHEDKHDELTIGKMSFGSKGMATDVIFILKESHIGIPVCKIKPLTMVEDRSDGIVVVSAVEDINNTLVILWPYKVGTKVVELLEIQHPPAVFSDASIVDLEMDQDGNIMYVLENKKGQTQCVCTKYLMP